MQYCSSNYYKTECNLEGLMVAYSGSKNGDQNALGRFMCYSCRLNKKWEMYDDLHNKKKERSVKLFR